MGLRSLKGQFLGLPGALKSIVSLCGGIRSKRNHSIVNNGTTAGLLQPVSQYIVAWEKSAPLLGGLSSKFLDHLTHIDSV